MARPGIGIIGLGIGYGHARGYAQYKGCDLVAVCDIDEAKLERVGRELSVPGLYNDHRELLADPAVEGVLVALPNYLHKPITVDALRAGVHVLVEKPMATTPEECQEMIDAAKAARRVLMVGLNNRFRTDTQMVKKAIDRGEIGKVYHAQTGWLRRRGMPGGWFREVDKSGGGPLIDLGVHMLDVTLYLMGWPKPVSVSGSVYRECSSFSVEDMAVAYIRLEGNRSLVLETSWESNPPHIGGNESQYVHLYGSKGGAQLAPPHLHKRLPSGVVDVSIDHAGWHKGRRAGGLAETFVRAVRTGVQPSPDGEEGKLITALLCAIYESGRTGREVVL